MIHSTNRFRSLFCLQAIVALVWALMAPAGLFGQVAGGTFTGTITDSSGLAIPGAEISIKNVDTGVVTKTTDNASGIFLAPNLIVGNYEVTASAKGFAPAAMTATLTVGATTVANLTLKIGVATQQVTVTAAPRAIQHYYNQGVIMYNTGKMDEAAAAFKKAIAIDPKFADSYFLMGQALIGKATTSPDGKIIAPAGTTDALGTYLKLAPGGQYAATAKQLLQTIQAGVQTQFQVTAQPRGKDQGQPAGASALERPDKPGLSARRLVAGRIKIVKCLPPAAMDLTLEALGKTFELHTDNYFKVDYTAANFTLESELQPCKQLQGFKARIAFSPYKDQPNRGVIISVELSK